METTVPQISIITPVYNPGAYFSACLESLEEQTIFDAIEVVLVDDGSSDGSEKLCDEFAAKHANIQVFHQTNCGQAAARNVAIAAAHGAHVLLVDSDDAIIPEACERLLSEAEASGADIVWGDYRDKSLFKDPVAQLCAEGPVSMARYMECALANGLFFVSPCVQLVSTAFLREHGIEFPEGRIFEDQQWLFELILANPSLLRIDFPFYIYNIGDHPSSTTVVTPKRLMDAIDVIYAMIGLLESSNAPEQVKSVCETFIANSIGLLAHTYIAHAPKRAQELARMRVNDAFAAYALKTQGLFKGSRKIGPAFVESQEAFEEELRKIHEAQRKYHEMQAEKADEKRD